MRGLRCADSQSISSEDEAFIAHYQYQCASQCSWELGRDSCRARNRSVCALKIMLFSNSTHHGSDDDYLPAFTYSSRSQPKHAFCYRQIRKSMAGALRQL